MDRQYSPVVRPSWDLYGLHTKHGRNRRLHSYTQIPTVHLVLGPSNADIMRIHARYPVLAFFLSIANINKRPGRSHHHQSPAQSANAIPLGPYGFVLAKSTGPGPWMKHLGLWAAHILSCVGAGIVIWQVYNIGLNAVVSWACPTDAYPIAWVVISVIHHVSAVICMRLSLRPADSSQSSLKRWSTLWTWDLTQPDLEICVTNSKWARWSKAINDLFNNGNYLYGTAVFSSLTLVAGHTAIQKLATFGVIAFLSKGATVWILESME